MSERCAKWGNAMQGRCAFDNMHEGPCDFEPSASEGERVEQTSEYLTDPLALAVLFHVTYEKLAPGNGYETRKETRIFDPDSANGKLMVATCAEVQRIIARLVPTKGGASDDDNPVLGPSDATGGKGKYGF